MYVWMVSAVVGYKHNDTQTEQTDRLKQGLLVPRETLNARIRVDEDGE
jgi:hypothetical protein